MTNHPILLKLGIGIEFPWDEYLLLHKKFRRKTQPIYRVYNELLKQPQHDMLIKKNEFVSAFNALIYRYGALVEHDRCFRSVLNDDTHYGRYKQEKELFEFFVSCLSVIEVFSYGLYFLASLSRKQKEFSITNRRNIGFPELLRKFKAHYPKLLLTDELKEIECSENYEKLREYRNILAHRNAPGRVMSPGDADTWKLDGILITPQLTHQFRMWISDIINKLMVQSRLFFEQNSWI